MHENENENENENPFSEMRWNRSYKSKKKNTVDKNE
jgi:hypothetical protein